MENILISIGDLVIDFVFGGKYVWSYAGVPFDDLKYHDSW